jgi:multidrug efflux pump subunit AcrB
MWIVRLALRRPFTVAMLCFLIFLFGLMSIKQMAIDIMPNIDIPVVIVVWQYNGLTAEDMEKRVVLYSERAYSTTVDNVEHLESQSIEGTGIIKLYFEPGTEMGTAIAQVVSVSTAIIRVLPPGITPPLVLRFNASNVQVAQLTVSSDTIAEQDLYDYGLNFIRVRLFTIPGLSLPLPWGGRARQVMVDVDPARAAAKGLSPEDVVNAVLASNVILPAGFARIGDTEYDITMNSCPLDVADFNTMPIKTINGVPVLLGDVAFVHQGSAVQTNIVRVNGRRATYLSILRKAGASTLAVVDAAKEMIPKIQATAPKGMNLRVDFDQSIFVRAAIKGVLREALLAGLLVSMMVLFFLGSWRSTLLVSTSIPLAILAGIVGLFLTGQSLNLMTLGGLSLAVGMLVDDATVEVENINRNRGLGKPLTVAILTAAHQVAVPALAATLTICIVFTPVVLLKGPARFLFWPLALAVVFSMLASYLLSRTLVPTLARKLLPKEKPHVESSGGQEAGNERPRGFNAWRDRHFERFRSGYARSLETVLCHPALSLIGILLFIAVACLLLPVVGLDFFPSVDTGQMRLHLRGPVGMRVEATEVLVQQVEESIRRIIPPEEVDTINDNIGLAANTINLAFVQTDNVGGWDADILIQLKPGHHPTVGYQRTMREKLPDEFPGTHIYFQDADVVTQVLNFGLPAPIDVQIQGRDVDAALDVARHLLAEIQVIPGTTDARIAQIFNHPTLEVDVDRQQASLVNVFERDIANSLLTSLSSSILVSPSYWIDPKNSVNYPVVVQTPLPRIASVDDLMTTPITPSTSIPSPSPPPVPVPIQTHVNELVPLSTTAPYLGGVAQLKTTQDRASISHFTVQPTVDVECGVDGRDLGAVAADIQRAIGRLRKPNGIDVIVRGQSEAMTTSFRSLALGLILAIVLVYVLLVVLFQSYRDPLIVLFALPGAFSGILWMLALTGTTLNVESMMGAIMSVGIATSNSILLVSFANQGRVEQGLSTHDAAMEAGRTRLRPVIMTALAMILGMLPMAFGLGEGGEQNAPLGRAVIGGLLVATFVTLFIVPLAYTLLRKAPPKAHELDVQFEAEAREGGAPGEEDGRWRPSPEPPPLHS